MIALIQVSRHYYISSLPADAKRSAHAVRSHWEVESVPQAHSKEVLHELTNCVEAARKMRVGPQGYRTYMT